MPQLSLYIDQSTLKKVEKAAKNDNISISKWVCRKLSSSIQDDWPENYFDLFGSIKDESFKRPEQITNFNQTPREEF